MFTDLWFKLVNFNNNALTYNYDMWLDQKLDPIGSAVLTFITYK